MKKSCKKIRELLPLYVDNITNQIESTMIKEHLDTCAECRQEYEFLKKIIATTATLPGIEASSNFNSKLHTKLVEAKNKNRKKMLGTLRKTTTAILTSAAVIAISVVSLNVINEKDMIDIESQPQATSEPLEISKTATESNAPADDTKEVPTETQAPKDSDNDQKADSNNSAQEATTATMTPRDTTRNDTNPTATPSSRGANTRSFNTFDKEKDEDKSEDTTLDSGINVASAGGGSGGAAKSPAPAQESVPSKIKVTVTVDVKDSDLALAKNILSGYSYSNGAYALSSSEYYQVCAKLDELGATTSITKEDKTSTYADLQTQLQNASGSEATSIQNKMNRIDNEISKTYVKLN